MPGTEGLVRANPSKPSKKRGPANLLVQRDCRAWNTLGGMWSRGKPIDPGQAEALLRAIAPSLFELGMRIGGLTLGACSLTDRSLGKLAMELATDERPAFGLLGDLVGGLPGSFALIMEDPIPPGKLEVELAETLGGLCEGQVQLSGGVADMRATIGEAIATRFATQDRAWVLRADWNNARTTAQLLMILDEDVWDERFHLAMDREAA